MVVWLKYLNYLTCQKVRLQIQWPICDFKIYWDISLSAGSTRSIANYYNVFYVSPLELYLTIEDSVLLLLPLIEVDNKGEGQN